MPAARGEAVVDGSWPRRNPARLDHDELDGCSDEDIFYILFGVPDGRMIRGLQRHQPGSIAQSDKISGAEPGCGRGPDFPAQRIVQRNCLFMTSVAFFEFQIYTANQREGASLQLARS